MKYINSENWGLGRGVDLNGLNLFCMKIAKILLKMQKKVKMVIWLPEIELSWGFCILLVKPDNCAGKELGF